MKRTLLLSTLGVLLLQGCFSPDPQQLQKRQKQKELLGKTLFFDKSLSQNQTQSCATCHDPQHAFIDPRDTEASGMVSLGDDGHSFGTRNAPTATYAMFSPAFHFDEQKQHYLGGQFYDGRAATLADQAGGPPLNPVEMGMGSTTELIERLKNNPYYRSELTALYGDSIWENGKKAYAALTGAIAAFEKTETFAPFDSKYDRYLRGEYELSALEDLGKALFFSNDNTNCSTCHMRKGEDRAYETFTNYEYHNIGTPANTLAAKLAKQTGKDRGLLENPAVTDKAHAGKIKVPTLRNVAVTAPYMHNGVFKELETVIRFYDHYNNPEAAVNPETGKKWKEPIFAATISKEELKARKLTDRKIKALVAFLKLLTDRRYEHLLER